MGRMSNSCSINGKKNDIDDCCNDNDIEDVFSCEKIMAIKTYVSNPGIANRLEMDVPGFSKYGFEFQRKQESSSCKGNNSTVETGFLYRREDNARPPLASIKIEVNDKTLLSSIGPFLRTLVRLCVDPIDPRSLQAIVVVFQGTTKKKMITARELAHEIHMLIRNSMGAALFLALRVVLPKDLKKESVLQWMQRNDDGCYEYPSVTLEEYGGADSTQTNKPFEVDIGLLSQPGSTPPILETPISRTCLQGFDPTKHFLSLHVKTRMCTLRLTPILYQLANQLLGKSNKSFQPRTPQASPLRQHQPEKQQLLVIGLEKLSNLYRVLMLVRDYGGLETIENNVVIMVKTSAEKDEFLRAAREFISKNLGSSSSSTHYAPRVVTVEQAVTLLLQQQQLLGTSLVAVDLHPNARTLGDNTTNDCIMLDNAGAIIWGFESDGIPELLGTSLGTDYVQIQSRTSVNVVAAVSILLHVMWTR